MKYIIIEDEPQAVHVIQHFIEKNFPQFSCLAQFDKVSDAARFIRNNPIDFAFLDVQLNGELGIDIGNYLSKEELNFELIFTTAYSQFALEAFDLCAIDYLLKPINEDRFTEAIQRIVKRSNSVSEQLELLHKMTQVETIDKIILKTHEGHFPIYLNDILFLKADNVYTEFHLIQNKRIVVSKPLKQYEALLSQTGFFKPHRSYIIHTKYIDSIYQNDITMTNQTVIPVSRDKKRELSQFLANSLTK